LGAHTTQRNEGYHPESKKRLTKHTPVRKAVQIITEQIDKLPKQYDDRVNRDRINCPRLANKHFFQHVIRRVTSYSLKMAMTEFSHAKIMLDDLEAKGLDFEFDPEAGCTIYCQLSCRFMIPCRCWMAYFFKMEQPVPANLFHPRWFYDGPESLSEIWEMKLDNVDYSYSTAQPTERYASDRFTNNGAQMFEDIAILMADKHQTLPVEERARFALAYQEINNKLVQRQDERLQSRAIIPLQLPPPIIQPKLTFGPGRKRALTGQEIAEQQERDELRARRQAERLSQQAQQAENLIDEHMLTQTQDRDDTAAAYLSQTADIGPSNTSGVDDDNEWQDIDDFLSPKPSLPSSKQRRPQLRRVPESKAARVWEEMQLQIDAAKSLRSSLDTQRSQVSDCVYISSDSDSLEVEANDNGDDSDFPTLKAICSQSIEKSPLLPNRRTRTKSKKQQSQENQAREAARVKEEKRRKRDEKKRRQSKAVDPSQLLDGFEIPLRSSQ
jgi:hypothetical protein